MLKIRISGSKEELRQVAEQMEDAQIRKFKQANGKVTYAIDSTISVKDFLEKNKHNGSTENENLKTINQELHDILDIMDETE